MKKKLRFNNLTKIFLFLAFIGFGQLGFGQVWSYDFGTATGSFSSSTASTSFLPSPTSGTARVRVGTNPGSIVLANPGISLGSTSEMQITSNTGSTSTTKMSIYDYTASKIGYAKFKIAFNGGTNGVYYFTMGDGANFSDNNAISTAQVFAGIQFTFGTSNQITYNVISGSSYVSTGLTNPTTLFSQSTSNEYVVEVYLNNNTTTTNYTKSGSNSLANATWDLWVNGVKVGTNLTKGGLGANLNIDSLAFNHQSNSSSPGTLYIDDIEYSNTLPSIPTYALTYNGNANTGGSIPASANYAESATVTVASMGTLVKTGFTFNGWNTMADGTGTTYAAGTTFSMPANAVNLYAQWIPSTSPNLTISGTLNEATLNNAIVTLTLANETFIDATLDPSNFTLNNAPSGVSIASVNYIDSSSASLTLAYDNTDFDSNITDFNITISAVELTASNPLTSNNLTINGLVETLTVGTISSFGNQCVDFLSAEQSFTISGSNLKAGTITLAALSGFSYSETANGTYTSTLSFSNTAGTLSNKIIFVKFLPTVVQSYNGNIIVSSVDAPNVNRSVVGSGINTLPAITTPTSTSITDSSATLGGNVTVVGCSSITERGIYYSTVSGFANGDGTKVSTFGTYSTGVFTIPVTGLSSNTVYYYKAFASSASGTAYTTQGTFTTNVLPVNVPYFQDFEGATNDFVLDATGTNRWVIGTGTNNGGTKAMYISNNTSTNSYSVTSATTTSASLLVNLSGLANASLSFDWKSNGEASSDLSTVYDYGEVYINTGSGDIRISSVKEFFNSTTFKNKLIDLSPYVGSIVTIKFRWVNDSSVGNQPPFAVDNISILPYGLPVLSTATVSDITYNSAISGGTVTSDGGDLITARGLVYATTSNPTLANNVINGGSGLGTYISNLSGLNSNTTYYVRAFASNVNGTYYGEEISFITTAIDAPVANEESDLQNNSFQANWDNVLGATAYAFDVYNDVEVLNLNQLIINNNGSVNAIGWTENSVQQGTASGNDYLQLLSSSSTLITPTIDFSELSNSKLNFNARTFGGPSVSQATITVSISTNDGLNWSTIGVAIPNNTTLNAMNEFDLSSYNGTQVKLRFQTLGASSSKGVGIDDVRINADQMVISEVFIPGYNNLNVGNVQTYTVSGLESGTIYFYRVRAIDANSVSQNSNTIEVTTTGTVRWTEATNTNWSTASNWSNDLVPDGTYDIEIPLGNPVLDTDFTVQTGRNLTISGAGTLTIAPTASLTIKGTTDFGGKSVILKSDATGTATIGEVSGTLTNATNVTVERYIPANRAWRLLTAPLKGISNNTIADNWQGTTNEGLLLFSPATFQNQTMTGYTTGGTAPNIFKYGTGWQIIPNLNLEAIFGATATDTKAYQVFVTGGHGSSNIVSGEQATTLRSTGELITGSVTHPLTANTFKLIANPYASPLNTEALVQANSGSKAWLLDPTVGFGAYVTYDGANWSIPEPSGNDKYIQSGQGFFVRSTETSFEIQESHKITGNSNTWFERNASSTADKIRVLLYKAINNEWQLADGILAVNSADGNTAVDNTDAGKISNFNESMMFRNGTSNLSIEYRALPQVNEVQPIRLTGTAVASYELRLFTENYNNSSLVPMLEDTQTGTFTTIPTDGSIVSVPFTGVVATGTNPDNRFRIVYQAALSNDVFNALNVSVYPNPVNEGFLNINLLEAGKATYNLYNLVGQEVLTGTLMTQNSQLTLSSLQTGVYILSIEQAGKKHTTKVVVE